eukprot:CAMPEP_0185806660 /NCGR_PEP_ID=MMETSP1322-20130828/4558_1 /TAXON_ID=265543 /ORGANISM="Minutocellus polymorphus, Strain RCC2270" /LENGTH=55 /DNA_ID=CAMNT_0028502753 /DNA_START=371 /DNA_END=534 /DNA_ORIENTATION=-
MTGSDRIGQPERSDATPTASTRGIGRTAPTQVPSERFDRRVASASTRSLVLAMLS